MGLALADAFRRAELADHITFCGRAEDPPGHPLFWEHGARYIWGLEAPERGTTAVFLSVPDHVLEEVAHALAARGPAPGGCAVFHLSGSLAADPLGPLHAQGYSVGTFHPLQTVASPDDGAQRLFGCSYALSGEPEALAVGQRLVAALDGKVLRVPASRRPLYHAAAVVASNYLVVLMDTAITILEDAGLGRSEAREAILPLARGTLENVARLGTEQALTGPVARGDVETVEAHLRGLGEDERRLYGMLGARALELAAHRLSPELHEEMEGVFDRVE